MNLMLLATIAACGQDERATPLRPWEAYHKGVSWSEGLRSAIDDAGARGKLVFYFHIVGNLNEESC